MTDLLRFMGFLALVLASIAAAAIAWAIGSTWKPEHTNALVYGLLSLSGLAVVAALAGLAFGAILAGVWLSRRPLQRIGADPELRNEYQVLRNEGARVTLMDRLLSRPPQGPVIEASTVGRFVDLADDR
jgi:hypothetical protein